MGGSRRLISNFFYGRLLCIHQIVYPMDGNKNKGFKGSSCSTYEASPVRTGNLAHSIQTQLPDHVCRLSSRNVKPL